jgi:dTDP-D-glucose 4,6-dehydratase
MIKYFNRKFFDTNLDGMLTWSRWYFPVITATEGLKEIDHYMQQSIRVLSTGRHNKSNYRITYEKIKALGWRAAYTMQTGLERTLKILK